MTRGDTKHLPNRITVIGMLVPALFIMAQAVTGQPAVAGAVSKTFRQSIAKKLVKAPAGTLSKAEVAALRREVAKLDKSTLDRITSIYGGYIPKNTIRAARKQPTNFYSKEEYRAILKKAYPWLSDAEIKSIHGNTIGKTVMSTHVDKNQPLLPRIVAHERLHQLSAHSGVRERIGYGMDEGMTEYLASKVYKDMYIDGLPKYYPDQVKVVQMLSALVGEDKIARAYFRGGNALRILREDVDRQLGKGAFDSISSLMDRGKYQDAMKVITRGRF